MNASIAKYAPKTKTYRMIISLTNRVMTEKLIIIEQRNIGGASTMNWILR